MFSYHFIEIISIFFVSGFYYEDSTGLCVNHTTSLRGKPAIVANGIRYLHMSESNVKILWRCGYMATKSLKCPARITQVKGDPVRFLNSQADHVHVQRKMKEQRPKTFRPKKMPCGIVYINGEPFAAE